MIDVKEVIKGTVICILIISGNLEHEFAFCRDFMSELFTSVRGPLSTTVSGSTLNVEGGSSLRRASSMRRTHQNAMASLKRKSVCMQAKFQVVGKKVSFYANS